MKNKDEILIRLAFSKGAKRIKRLRIKEAKRRKAHENYLIFKKKFKGDFSYENVIEKFLPTNISYLLSCDNSDFSISKLKNYVPENAGIFRVPENFSIIDNAVESYKFIREITAALILQKYQSIKIDYNYCKAVDLSAQVFFDIILKDIITFFKKCEQYPVTRSTVKNIGGINVKDVNVKKLLYSVGSPAIHSNKTIHFDDIIPYKLCIHDRESNADPIKISEKKDIDTTTLVEYVLDSLKRLNKTLTPEKLDDLCTVIGEILINAEEHSTTKYRFSIGYFQEITEEGKHYGVFKLTILNFGKTIYEKFKDPNCPNQHFVEKMNGLSNTYTKKNYFFRKQFEEETLWTLYALQEGVTSVATEKYKKRGNGSIQFIESFFNIKGRGNEQDNISRMAILSGNTMINFDGTYNIVSKEKDGENFKFMTFNKSGEIDDKPDSKFVKFVDNYFPGTLIGAKILFNEDDLTDELK